MGSEYHAFQQIVFAEALKTSTWKKYFQYLSDSGVSTVEELLETSDETLDSLKQHIPISPLNRIKSLKQNLIKIKQQRDNSFAAPLGQNAFFDEFEFVPQFTFEQYLGDSPINDINSELSKAKRKVESTDHTGLTKHQAVFITLYCQEPSNPNSSFYYLSNLYLRERKEQLICLRPALYLLESGLVSLPPVKDTTWRGMNVAPDLKKFVVGKTVCFTGICSTTADKDQTLQFMEIPPRSGIHKRSLFKLHMTNGVSIQNWSHFEREQEVVASFCSRWEVLQVEKNYEEVFDSVGSYRCDYYIELRQLDSQPLFRSNVKLTGLHMLSKIDFEKPDDLSSDFKSKFVSFFHQLHDATAQKILELVLENSNYWNKEQKDFKNNPENKEIFELITQFLQGVKDLATEFQHHDIDLRRGFEICETHDIYTVPHLLYDKEDGAEREIADFQNLGFEVQWATKLYNQEHVKQELQILFKKFNYNGEVDSPQNISKWLSSARFKHYVHRDGIIVSIYELAHISVNGAKHLFPKFRKLINGSIQFDNFKVFGKTVSYEIQYSDFAIAAVIFAVQLGTYSFQLWHGDITTRQFLKSVSCAAVSVVTGFVGGAAAGYLAACGVAALSLSFWPATILVLLGTAAGGLIVGGGADMLFRYLSEKFFPDGENEELNAQRKLYCAALEKLACNPDSSMRNIQTAYHRKALATHPDRCDNKEAAKEEFQKILAAYEIAKNYHEVLQGACTLLGIPSNFTEDDLKPWKAAKKTTEMQRAYSIAYRHVVYNTNSWKCTRYIRDLLDSDQNLKPSNPNPLPIQSSK